MPTVVDPETKAKTNPAEAPIVKERELFADEVEMERKSSNLGPFIMIAALVAEPFSTSSRPLRRSCPSRRRLRPSTAF